MCECPGTADQRSVSITCQFSLPARLFFRRMQSFQCLDTMEEVARRGRLVAQHWHSQQLMLAPTAPKYQRCGEKSATLCRSQLDIGHTSLEVGYVPVAGCFNIIEYCQLPVILFLLFNVVAVGKGNICFFSRATGATISDTLGCIRRALCFFLPPTLLIAVPSRDIRSSPTEWGFTLPPTKRWMLPLFFCRSPGSIYVRVTLDWKYEVCTETLINFQKRSFFLVLRLHNWLHWSILSHNVVVM